jgi:hypothetical protein
VRRCAGLGQHNAGYYLLQRINKRGNRRELIAMTKKADRDDVANAQKKLDESGVDELTVTTMKRSLTLSEGAIYPEDGQDQQQATAEAIFGLTLSIAHFIAGSHKQMDTAVSSAIKGHIGECQKLKEARAMPTGKLGSALAVLAVVKWPVCIMGSVWILTDPKAVEQMTKIALMFTAVN